MGGPQVGLAGGGYAAVGPRLAGGPFHGVVPVQSLLEQGIVFPFRLEATPAVLADHHVTPLGKEPDGMFLVVGVPVLPVGASGDQHREAPRRIGAVHIGGQPHAVAHGNHNIAFPDNPVLRRLRHNLSLARYIGLESVSKGRGPLRSSMLLCSGWSGIRRWSPSWPCAPGPARWRWLSRRWR